MPLTVNGRPIVTSHTRLSPHPNLDWCAWRDGDEESGIRGWGATEAAAIADLLDSPELED